MKALPGARWRGGILVGLVAAAVLAFLYALPEPGDRAPPPGASVYAIRDARVFDGERVLERATVLVRDGRIEALGADLAVPADATVIEGRGRTLLPGLIDAHVHTWGGALADALNFGVTTVLDMYSDPALSRELRPSRESHAPLAHADLWSSGFLATAPGGHGTQFGLPVPTLTTPAEAPAWVRARLAEGSDYVKIVYEPKGPGGLGPPFPSLDRATLEALVAAAHAERRRAVVHVSRLGPAREALAAGADGLVHVWGDQPADARVLELARAHDAFVVPTLAVTLAFAGAGTGAALAADPAVAPFLSPEQRQTLVPEREVRVSVLRPEVPVAAVRALHAAGVDVLAGSDAPNPGTAHGASLHAELELLVQAGLTPLQALAAATSVPARRFALADRGRIAPGLRADLLLVRGDPAADVRATRAIERIWKNGATVERRRYPPPR